MKRSDDIQVGDIVMFREWMDMADEYGTEGDSIACNFWFTPNMKGLCGKEFKISSINPSGSIGLTSEIQLYRDLVRGFAISSDMLTKPGNTTVFEGVTFENIILCAP